MSHTRLRTLLVVAVLVGVATWSALRLVEASGGLPLPLPWTALGGMLVIALAVLVAGWPVRRWTRGDRSHRLDALRAARTVVLAKASAYSGAGLAGFYAAQGVLVLPHLQVEPQQDRLLRAGLAVLCAVVMVAAGLLVERWCRLPDDEDDRSDHEGSPRL
jgi:ABC-type branched-subunit amino acid transport system permease subunit